jgi:hypothetical protein
VASKASANDLEGDVGIPAVWEGIGRG